MSTRLMYWFVIAALLIGGSVAYLFLTEQTQVSWLVFAAGLGACFVFFAALYVLQVMRPLKILIVQMRALLTGKTYRKIFTRRTDEIGIIAHFFNEVTKSIEKVSGDIKEGKRMLNELEIAAQLQRDILPTHNPDIKGLDVVAKTRPAVELGGDSFEFITRGDTTFLYVGDVTGHGVPAALVMTMVNALIHTFVEVYDTAYDVVVHTNKQLKTRIQSTMFMTMVMLRWDAAARKMSFIGCGHEYLLIYRAVSGKCEVQKAGGIALGMVPDMSKLVTEKEIPLAEGDVIILYTDGITEGRNMAGEMYGIERLTKAVERFAQEYGPDGIVNHVALDYSRFVEDHVQDDDVTLMAVQYTGVQKGTEKPEMVTTAWKGDDAASE